MKLIDAIASSFELPVLPEDLALADKWAGNQYQTNDMVNKKSRLASGFLPEIVIARSLFNMEPIFNGSTSPDLDSYGVNLEIKSCRGWEEVTAMDPHRLPLAKTIDAQRGLEIINPIGWYIYTTSRQDRNFILCCSAKDKIKIVGTLYIKANESAVGPKLWTVGNDGVLNNTGGKVVVHDMLASKILGITIQECTLENLRKRYPLGGN